MSNVFGTRLDETYSQKLEKYADKRKWTPSQALREIVTLFFDKDKARRAV